MRWGVVDAGAVALAVVMGRSPDMVLDVLVAVMEGRCSLVYVVAAGAEAAAAGHTVAYTPAARTDIPAPAVHTPASLAPSQSDQHQQAAASSRGVRLALAPLEQRGYTRAVEGRKKRHWQLPRTERVRMTAAVSVMVVIGCWVWAERQDSGLCSSCRVDGARRNRRWV